jgi:hypothetical protein
MNMKYRENRFGNAIEVMEETDEKVTYIPMGGGMIESEAPDKVYAAYPLCWTGVWHQIWVDSDWMETPLKAWTTGERWNGWAMPCFELAEALEVQKSIPELLWHPEDDAFSWKPEGWDEGDGPNIFKGHLIEVDGKHIKVYKLGDGWCWNHGERVDDLKPEAIAGMTAEQTKVVRELRHAGYAVIVWTPDEVGTANPRKVEDRSISLGWDVIGDLKDEE